MDTSMYRHLWGSRKVRIAIIDAIVAAAVLIVTTFFAPDQQQFWLALIAILQVPVGLVIAGIAYEDGKAKEGGVHPAMPRLPHGEQG
jgi:peptidoglycan/LPS O-acetylase OafA/YrhL